MATEESKAKETIALPEGLNVEKYNEWKSNWGDLVRVIEVPSNKSQTEFKSVVIKSPENDISICDQMEKYIDTNLGKTRKIAIENCVLFGKEMLQNNNIMYRACSMYLIEQIPYSEARLKG